MVVLFSFLDARYFRALDVLSASNGETEVKAIKKEACPKSASEDRMPRSHQHKREVLGEHSYTPCSFTWTAAVQETPPELCLLLFVYMHDNSS